MQEIVPTEAFVLFSKNTVEFINKILRDEAQLNNEIIINTIAVIAVFAKYIE